MRESEQFSKLSLHDTENLSDMPFRFVSVDQCQSDGLTTKPLYAIQCGIQNRDAF